MGIMPQIHPPKEYAPQGSEKEFSNYDLRVGDGNPLPTEVNEFDEDEEDHLISIDRTLIEEQLRSSQTNSRSYLRAN